MNNRSRLVRSAVLLFGIFGAISEPLIGSDPFASPSEPVTPSKHSCLSLVAGFPKSWFFVMSEQFCVGGTDDIFARADWPKASIASEWVKGFHITSVAGDKDGWIVVTNNRCALTEQIYFGPGAFPKNAIDEQLKSGFRITSVAGYNDQWVVVMSKGTGISRQLYTSPTSFQDREEWIKARSTEGYRITVLAGDNGTKAPQYVIVLSSDSGISEQTVNGPAEFPGEWIKQKWDEGYEITSATGYGSWIVVMSKGLNLGDQSWERGQKIPGTWFAKQGMSGILEKDDFWDIE